MVGRILRTANKFYEPGKPAQIFTSDVAEGLRGVLNMCHHCKKFKPGDPDNCEAAEEQFRVNRKNTTSTITCRCGHFEQKEARHNADA